MRKERRDLSIELAKTPSIRERAFILIRQKILNGEYKPQDKLIESKLAHQLGISRTPIREALHRLEAENLVKIYPRKFCEVIGITEETIREINLIRQQLEPLAAQVAAEKMHNTTIDSLEELLDLADYYHSKQDINRLIEAHDKFHRTIINQSQMKRLIKILENIHDYIDSFRMSFLSRDSLVQRSLDEHRMILDALKKRDSDKVYEYYKDHLSGIGEYENVILEDLY